MTSTRRAQTAAIPGLGVRPPAATTRRLMKEYESIRDELASPASPLPSAGSDGYNSEADSKLFHVAAAIEDQNNHHNYNPTNKRRSKKAGKKASANPDLLELRPWDADGEDLFEWFAIIRGPKGGAYEGGTFELSITVPASYPTKPPSMQFKTKIWHPNVGWKTGEICLDVLSSQWSPAWTLSSACTAVLALLDAPEPDSPLNVDAATLLRTGDLHAYRSMCRMYTLLHAASLERQ